MRVSDNYLCNEHTKMNKVTYDVYRPAVVWSVNRKSMPNKSITASYNLERKYLGLGVFFIFPFQLMAKLQTIWLVEEY